MTTIVEMNASGDETEFSMTASAHADIPLGGRGTRTTLIQARAARTPDGYTSADTRVLSDDFTWTTIISLAGDTADVPTPSPGQTMPEVLEAYGRDLIERTVRILAL